MCGVLLLAFYFVVVVTKDKIVADVTTFKLLGFVGQLPESYFVVTGDFTNTPPLLKPLVLF